MKIEQLLADIKEVESQITTLENCVRDMQSRNDKERCASISCNGSWSVRFTYAEVSDQIERRRDGLQVKLGRLLESKKAAEITMEGWLNQSKGMSHE